MKSLKQYIIETFKTSSVAKIIKNKQDIVFLVDKADNIDIISYLKTFVTKDVRKILDATTIRFLIYHYHKKFYIFVFNSNILHNDMVELLDFSKNNYSPLTNKYTKLYRNCFKGIFNPNEYCIAGTFLVKLTLSCDDKYMEELVKNNIHNKLGLTEKQLISAVL